MSKLVRCWFCGKGFYKKLMYAQPYELRRIACFKLFMKKPESVPQKVFIKKVAEKMKVSERTVERYLRIMKSQTKRVE